MLSRSRCKIVLGDSEIDIDRILQLNIDQSRSSGSDIVSGINESSSGPSIIGERM